MRFWNFKKIAAAGTEPEHVELRIEGDIVDDDDVWIYEWYGLQCVSPNGFKAELEEYAGMPVVVWIDSYGGSVFAAAGIYNALKEHKGTVTVKIDGKAMSAASVIAMAGDKILMSPVAVMMVHNPLTEVYGYASDLRQVADILDEIKEAIVNAYQLKSGRSRNKISAMMDDETYMSAKTAMKEGFADGMLYEDAGAGNVDMSFARGKVLGSTTDAVKRIAAKLRAEGEPQKAVKPNRRDADHEDHFTAWLKCGSCGHTLASYDFGGAWCDEGKDMEKPDPCPKCGTPVDWSDYANKGKPPAEPPRPDNTAARDKLLLEIDLA
jgi:ATP-dependent Clp protease protease subunit